jgi:hypothetical protein
MASRTFVENKGVWKQIPLSNGQVKSELIEMRYNTWTVAIYNGVNNLISITKNGETRTYNVKDDETREFTIQIRKTFLRGTDAADGLFDFFDRWCSDCCAGGGFIYLNKIWEYTKKFK